MGREGNRYSRIIAAIFHKYYRDGSAEVSFRREDLIDTAHELGISLPKNIGDIVYSFRYRANLPESIRSLAPESLEWIIRSVGQGQYKFALASKPRVIPSELLVETKILDATPGIIAKYALSDEQALLARLRYNRLIDIFTGVTCYSLQSHLRTNVAGMRQVETDELYVGVDQRGAQYVFPIQAKGGSDKLAIIQIEQDLAMCSVKFPELICRPIAAQFIKENLIALFCFEEGENGTSISVEKHYRLVSANEMTAEELKTYRGRSRSDIA